MFLKILCLLLVVVAASKPNDPVGDQLPVFKKEHPEPIGTLTTSAGSPVELKESRVTLNKKLIINEYLMDTLTHFIRQRIPERIVHAKGTGGFGYFEVSHDITDICKAKLFEHVGKKTPLAVRFSPADQETGGNDLAREIRGFAVKFYTEEGNFDFVGIDVPAFVFKDPLLFPTFNTAERRNPTTNIRDTNQRWDFLTTNPETLFAYMFVFGDRGIPDGYRYLPGFSVHTYQIVNDKGESHFVRFHILPDSGIRNLPSDVARNIGSFDADYATRDLYRAIGRGDYPTWTLSVQVLSVEDVKNADFDVFDVTKILPLNKYPLRPVGKLVINQNPNNQFAEIEQIAFSPANLVPGILGAPDKIFESRRLAYRDTQYYRLGSNFHRIPVNCPLMGKAKTYNRNGRPPVLANGKDSPIYFPNTYNGPMPYVEKNKVELIEIYEQPPNNFKQAGELYANDLTKDERSRLIANILDSLCDAAKNLQERAVELYHHIHHDLGHRIAEGLRSNCTTPLPDRWMDTPVLIKV